MWFGDTVSLRDHWEIHGLCCGGALGGRARLEPTSWEWTAFGRRGGVAPGREVWLTMERIGRGWGLRRSPLRASSFPLPLRKRGQWGADTERREYRERLARAGRARTEVSSGVGRWDCG